MAFSLVIGGVIMWVVDAWSVRRDPAISDVDQMSLPQAIWIGLCQVTSAVFPGTSRSMSTIAAGQLAGMTRPAALEFSFLVSIPTMFAATLYDLVKALFPGVHLLHRHSQSAAAAPTALAPAAMDSHGWWVLIIGFLVSFFVALGVVEWFL
jgi:undecaprenyl-diphosphatase